MIWLTWRQQRAEVLIAGAVLALVTAFLLKTGTDMENAFQQTGLAACIRRNPSPEACQSLAGAFTTRFAAVTNVIPWLNLLPSLLGVLLAAPLVLELEHGTYRFAWTQSVTRGRWLAIKLGLMLAAAVVGALTVMVLMTWWNGPLDHLGSRLTRDQFDFEGIVPIAYTVFAAALCLAAGSLLRRTAPAIGLTLVGYLAVRTGIETFVGFGYVAPVTRQVPFGTSAAAPGPATRADYFIGSTASIPKDIMRACFGGALTPPPPGSAGARLVQACFGRHGVFASVVYQPAGRFWLFQGIESALYLVPAVALLALAAWIIRTRIA